MIYPQKLSSKKGNKLINILLISSILLAFILIIINRLTTPSIPWAALTNCGIIYVWITVLYSIKKRINIAGHVLLQTIIISAVLLYIDKELGFKGWSIHIAIPIVLMIANLTMLILTIVSYKKYIKYAIYQLMIVLISMIPMVFIMEKMIQPTILNIVAIVISIINLIISLVLSYRDVKDAVIRKFHM